MWIVLAIFALSTTVFLLVYGRKPDDNNNRPQPCIGAVASNGAGCAEIGGKILKEGGSAVDAAIATLLCEGLVLPHSMGIGGGFCATIYTKETGHVETLIARETAPNSAHQDMYINVPITGAIAAAVPGEIYGYWCLHQKYGKLLWKMLFEPAIKMCTDGIKVSIYLANVLTIYGDRLRSEPSMVEIFVNPKTKEMYKEKETMYRPKLAETLRILADEGPQVIYGGGRIGKQLVQDIQEMGGIITEQDLMEYEVRWEEPIFTKFAGGYQLFTTPLPTCGVLIAFILNILEPLYTRNRNVYWQRVIESFKHAYGHRTNLGDIHFEPQVCEEYKRLQCTRYASCIRNLIDDNRTSTDFKCYHADFVNVEDNGTVNVSVLAPNGDAIAVTSTINSHLGAKVRSCQTGIILNDEMDDFSTPGVINTYDIPASPANFIKPGKRPLSSICPSIILDSKCQLRLIIGGAGGSRITTSVVAAILRYFYFNEPVDNAVNSGRLHHQLAPMSVDVEPNVPSPVVDYLIQVGHDVKYFLASNKVFSALTAIGLKTPIPHPVCDCRRLGSAVVVHFER